VKIFYDAIRMSANSGHAFITGTVNKIGSEHISPFRIEFTYIPK